MCKLWWNTGYKNYSFLLYLPFTAWKEWNEEQNNNKKNVTTETINYFLFPYIENN